MTLTPEEQAELTRLEAAFEANGSRGVDDAERIDQLRYKQNRQPIHRTIFQIEVFSLGLFEEDGEFKDLQEIYYAIDEGDCVGDVTRVSVAVVPDDQVYDNLLRIGNDGHFFDDPDDHMAGEA